ncbi:MAG: single-stranded-DNA-specific exonuclease RecJ [Alphaproteobacteria bacterium]|nr:single-stranded-DNA-specific exonuclease RecJ [Alphaproteobacteria bacterium]PHX98226.1 MAG: single-stranded-DNA-specific exonuclease RecJ [Rhodospirillaceae bacterium]
MAPAPAPNLFETATSLCGRQWVLNTVDNRLVEDLSRQAGVNDVLARVLAARGVTLDTVHDFLHPTLKTLMPDPSTLAGMDQAVERLVVAINSKEKIGVFGDYDVDGATSSAVLRRFFRSIGIDPVMYIPDRMKEGYGPNTPALLALAEQGVKIVITVDCGISAYEPLKAAKEAGLDVIVADHHKADPVLPVAAAVVNPNRLDDTSKQGHLAAVGVTFLLLVALNRALRVTGWYRDNNIAEPDLRQLLDIVALGTVADVVPLIGLNRAFVIQGLSVLARGANVGLAAMRKVAAIDVEPSAYHLGFIYGPRVNAGGRVGQADLGMRILSTDDPDEAAALAVRLDDYNRARQDIEAAVLAEAIEQVETRNSDDPVLFAMGASWHPGVIGIVASRLKDRYGRPACVVALDGGMAKGSGRSVKGVDLGKAVLAARDVGLLFNGGGHAMAAGFTVEEAKLSAFVEFMTKHVVAQMKAGVSSIAHPIDGVLSVNAVTTEFAQMLGELAPYGSGNDEPRFAVVDADVGKADIVGSGHVRCFLTGRTGGRLKAIAFRSADSDLGVGLLNARGRSLHLTGTIRVETWQGRANAQLIIDDAIFAA